MDPLDSVPWLYDTGAKNILRHFVIAIGASLLVFGSLYFFGLPGYKSSGPFLFFACLGVYGWIWGFVLLFFRLFG